MQVSEEQKNKFGELTHALYEIVDMSRSLTNLQRACMVESFIDWMFNCGAPDRALNTALKAASGVIKVYIELKAFIMKDEKPKEDNTGKVTAETLLLKG
jgi:hypothetical protein